MRRFLSSLCLLVLPFWSGFEARSMELIFSDGFESGTIDLSRWNPQVYDQVEGATLVTQDGGGPVRSGQYALRIKLSKDDPLDPGGKTRSELRPRISPNELAYDAPYSIDHVYEVSIWLPADWQPDAPEIVAQWHGTPDRDAEGNESEPRRAPPVALRTTYLEVPAGSNNFVPAWNIVAHWDASQTTPWDESTVNTVTVLEPVDASNDLGTWVDWRFEVRWDWNPAGDGSLRVLKGNTEIASYIGPNAYNDVKGPNSKIGSYKWNWPTADVDLRILYYDDVRIFRDASMLPALGPGGAALTATSLGVLGILLTCVNLRSRRQGNTR